MTASWNTPSGSSPVPSDRSEAKNGLSHSGAQPSPPGPRPSAQSRSACSVTVRPFRRWPANAIGGVNTKLMRLDIPMIHALIRRLDLGAHLRRAFNQALPCRMFDQPSLHWLKPAVHPAMQRVVRHRLIMRAMLGLGQGTLTHDKT